MLIPLPAIPMFLVWAVSLLVKNRSTLSTVCAFLFWPYWLLLGLTFVGRFFQESGFRTLCCFACFVAPVLFAFAAGGVLAKCRAALVHATALVGLAAMPWIYWTTIQDTPMGNTWTMFNLPDEDLRIFNGLWIVRLTIVAVGLTVLAVLTAALRLPPVAWKFQERPLGERTWPAVTASCIFLATWFSQSVMPYRIPGAVDYSRWPVIQILHVEKRGLQFHEMCISVYGYRNEFRSISFSGDDRRLFQYRFPQSYTSAEVPESLTERIRGAIQTPLSQKESTTRPLRAWKVDAWYFTAQGIGLTSYRSDNNESPPQFLVDLFRELEKIPNDDAKHSDRKDVCLGFCYDAFSAMGWLYANHRCGYDSVSKSYVCR